MEPALGVSVTVTTASLDRVDVFLDERLVASADVKDDTVAFDLTEWAAEGQRLALAGYEEGGLAAARAYTLTPPDS